MVDARRILREHRAKVLWRDGTPVIRCDGDGFEFESMGDFGQHVDRLSARLPRSRGEAVEDTLSMHLGDLDPISENSLDVYADDHGRVHCGCGWTGRKGVDCDEWREHLARAILESLEKVDEVSGGASD